METTIAVDKLKTTKIRPLYDRVLIRRQDPKDVVKNGLYIPDNAVEKPMEGEVVAIGSGKLIDGVLVPLDIKIGDVVIFGRYAGNEVECLGEKFLLLQENEIMACYYEE